jgi:hypothetical protein
MKTFNQANGIQMLSKAQMRTITGGNLHDLRVADGGSNCFHSCYTDGMNDCDSDADAQSFCSNFLADHCASLCGV